MTKTKTFIAMLTLTAGTVLIPAVSAHADTCPPIIHGGCVAKPPSIPVGGILPGVGTPLHPGTVPVPPTTH